MARRQYYVIEHEDQRPDTMLSGRKATDYCEITTRPGRTNMSGEERADGWLGTTNDWNAHAHGEFSRIADARRKCRELGYVVLADRSENDEYNDTTIEVYHIPGEEWEVGDWLQDYSPSSDRLSSRSTDRRIEQVATRLEREATREGARILGDVEEYLRARIARS